MSLKIKSYILSYRESDLTMNCLNSIGQQFSTTIFSNGHRPQEDLIYQQFSCDIHKQRENLSFASVVNSCIKSSKMSDFLLFTTNDIVYERNCIDYLINTMELDRSIDVLGPLQLHPETNEIHHAGGTFTRKTCRADVITEKPHNSHFIPRDWIDGAAVLIRLSSIKRNLELREEYGFYWEDVDWGIRINEAGLKVGICPSAICFHKSGSTTDSFGYWKKYILTRNRALCARLNLSEREFRHVRGYLMTSFKLKEIKKLSKIEPKIQFKAIQHGLSGRTHLNNPVSDDELLLALRLKR